jgi:hypothetical protein
MARNTGYGRRDDEAEATMAKLARSGCCDAVNALVTPYLSKVHYLSPAG